MKIIPPTMRPGKMLLRNQAENISVITQIWEVSKLPPQPIFWGELSTFLQNEIRESYYDEKIHENQFYEILVIFYNPFSIIQAFTSLWAMNNKEMAALSK